ncbi:MAG: ABC transporter substrate-binding protein [Proteobacteria bacterium]|nr:ABC transporter substrate-binding protein [Pseudomonadota bacterium]
MRKSAISMLVAILAAAICSTTAMAKDEVRVAAQFGLGYAPLFALAKKPEFLQKYAPDADVKFIQLTGGAAVREALLSDSADIGGLAMLPVIQAWAKGADLKVALGLSDMPIQLITWNPDLKTIKDLKRDDKINVISIGSPQTLVMKMAAMKYFGSPTTLDNHFVTMAHPDAVAAVISKRGIVAEFATPPYIRMLLKHPDMHVILSNKDFAEADFMLICAAAGKRFVEGKPKLYGATIHALKDVIEWMNTKPEEAAAFFAANQPGKLSADDWLAEMKQPGVRFSPAPRGLANLSAFMAKIGVTAKAGTYEELTWSNLRDGTGN